MPRLNLPAILGLAGVLTATVEKIRTAPAGQTEQVIIDGIEDAVPQIETLLGVDIVNDEALKTLLSSAVTAQHAFVEGLAAANI